MIGAGAQISVEHGVSAKGKVFANIGSISPVLDGLEGKVVPVESYLPYLEPRPGATPVAKPAAQLDNDEIPF